MQKFFKFSVGSSLNFLQLACKLSPLPVGQRSARDSQTTGRHVVRGAGAEGDEAEGVVAEEVRHRDSQEVQSEHLRGRR